MLLDSGPLNAILIFRFSLIPQELQMINVCPSGVEHERRVPEGADMKAPRNSYACLEAFMFMPNEWRIREQ